MFIWTAELAKYKSVAVSVGGEDSEAERNGAASAMMMMTMMLMLMLMMTMIRRPAQCSLASVRADAQELNCSTLATCCARRQAR